MTFTIAGRWSTCDDCDATLYGTTWRELGKHACPRVTPTPPIPTGVPCEHCSTPLRRRANEDSTNFRRRRFCGNSCARRAQAKARKEKAA